MVADSGAASAAAGPRDMGGGCGEILPSVSGGVEEGLNAAWRVRKSRSDGAVLTRSTRFAPSFRSLLSCFSCTQDGVSSEAAATAAAAAADAVADATAAAAAISAGVLLPSAPSLSLLPLLLSVKACPNASWADAAAAFAAASCAAVAAEAAACRAACASRCSRRQVRPSARRSFIVRCST